MNEVPSILPLGPDGVLVRFSDRLSEPANRAALAYQSAVAKAMPAGVVEAATSLTSVFFRFRPDQISRAKLEAVLQEALGRQDWADVALPSGRRLWRIPVHFGKADGPDLDEVAAAVGISPETAVDEICAQSLRVLALGFAPGQPYLGFLPEHWDIPRRSDVTPEVPRGAVVVAVRQVIPFANAAPTGWRQVGRTGFRCHDPAAAPPVPLRAGDEVRFQSVSAAELARLETDGAEFGGAVQEMLE